MDLDDKELFSSAMTADEIPDAADTPAEAPETEAPQQEERPRDEQGRFAKQVEPEPKPEQAEPAKDEAHVPPWRLREIKEERDAINRRYLETQRQFEMLQRQVNAVPKEPPPDLFENPNGFVDQRLKEYLTPYEQQQQQLRADLQETREFYSRRDAERDHGPEAVRESYNWLAQGIQARNPDVLNVYYQVMQSKHPYDAIVSAHKRMSVMQQIDSAGDLDKWVMQRAAELQQRGQASPQGNGRQASNGSSQGNSIVKLPPSMRNLPASQVDGDDDSDMSDAAMFRQAMR